jgi:hypothetical protein
MFESIKRLLTSARSKRVSFADGSYIEWCNREAILYAEPGVGTMEIPWVFSSALVSGRTLRASDIDKWNSPDEAKQVTPEKRAEVIEKIREYCRRRRIPLSVDR